MIASSTSRTVARAFWPVLVALCLVSVPGIAEESGGAEEIRLDWVISVDRAVALIEEGDATVLDARGRGAWKRQRVEGAVPVDWEAFTPESKAARGTLLEDDDELARKLQGLGVSDERPVVVLGAADGGWGEAGRIVWMLRSLGHGAAAWVDGGHEAVVEAGVSTTDGGDVDKREGEFTVDRRDDWSIDRATLEEIYRGDDVVLLDTREPREYAGKTPYGEARGGHIPGAEHLYFKTLLRDDGRLKAARKIREMLEERGVGPEDRVVTYCTGGVRSAWVASVLVDLGYDVRNYAGSTWQWASGPADRFPLEKRQQGRPDESGQSSH